MATFCPPHSYKTDNATRQKWEVLATSELLLSKNKDSVLFKMLPHPSLFISLEETPFILFMIASFHVFPRASQVQLNNVKQMSNLP